MNGTDITTQASQAESVAVGLLDCARAHVVESDDGVTTASSALRMIADAKRNTEEQRQFFVRPLNDQVTKINALFKKVAAPLMEADVIIRQKVVAYRVKTAEEARKEQARLDALAQAERARVEEIAKQVGVEAPEIETPQVAPTPKPLGAVGSRKIWAFEIVDPALVPEKYKVVDKSLVMAAIRDGYYEIPGLRIYQEETVVVR